MSIPVYANGVLKIQQHHWKSLHLEFFFKTDRKTTQSAQCEKSKALTKVIDSIIYIESFEKQCLII